MYEGDPWYKCPECEWTCPYWQDLVDHLAKKHLWGPYKIDNYMNWVWARRREQGSYR